MKKAKKILCVVGGVLVVFAVYNIIWFSWTNSKYKSYVEGMETFVDNRSYVLAGQDDYMYNVKYPDYLSFTGNLAVATPDEKEALIIWPGITEDYEYGIQIEFDGEIQSIMVDSAGKAIEEEYAVLLEGHEDTISQLFEKAHDFWGVA